MAKTHIDRVAHELKARNTRALLFKELAHAIHVRISKRDQPDGPPAHVDHLRAGNCLEKSLNVREQFRRIFEEHVMRGRTARIPVAKVLPRSVRRPVKHLTLSGQHVIGLRGKAVFSQALDNMMQLTPRVDRPQATASLERCERLEKCCLLYT